MSLTFTHDELLELLRNRARAGDRIDARAADRLDHAIDLLKRARTLDDADFKATIDAFLQTNN